MTVGLHLKSLGTVPISKGHTQSYYRLDLQNYDETTIPNSHHPWCQLYLIFLISTSSLLDPPPPLLIFLGGVSERRVL